MNSIIQHPQFGELRVEKHLGETVFCVADLCKTLNHTNARMAVKMLDEDELVKKSLRRGNQSLGNDEAWFCNESGMYTLIIRSNLPTARKFRKWITAEVLPSLRKYGIYSTDTKVMDRAKAKAEQKAIKQLLTEVDNRLSYTDKRLVAKQCLTTEYHVNNVLAGKIQDAYMMSLLYARATGNIEMNKLFYSQTGADNLTQELIKKQLV